ncbi:MAG TPA: ABC transporter ATP-binding protein [Vicinamibacteria bacterium]|nr:ABC transporter ATP-binding protein [Vicinamibacteria bacterium]
MKTENLRMVFRAGHLEVPALRGVDIEVDRGEFVSIMGPSGCGKSTLLHLLGGLARPTSGHIFVDGLEMSVASDTERTRTRREKIGFVFQRFNLLPTLTVRGNLEIARQIQGEKPPPRERLMELLEMVGLPHKSQMKPLELSAGEQQRIAIARALVNNPAILLADEPTGNLDSMNSGLILDLFKGLNRRLGQTILMITHNPEAAAVTHRRVEMRDGRVISPGAFPQVATGGGT